MLYAVDVSQGMGVGTSRQKRWNRLKDFMKNINNQVIKGVETDVMVYNIEPRILNDADHCDEMTEYFVTADQCLCNKKYNIYTRSGCTVNGPADKENRDDWGKLGPRTGVALKQAKELYFEKDRDKYKNIILLLSHQTSTDDVESAEKELRRSGISLVDIELGQRHDLRKRTFIPRAGSRRDIVLRKHPVYSKLQRRQFIRHRQKQLTQRERDNSDIVHRKTKRTSGEREPIMTATSNSSDNEQHRMKVSLKKLSDTLRTIISKVCKTKSTDLDMRKRSLDYSDFY